MIAPHDILVGFVFPLILASVVMLLTRRAWGAALAAGAAYVLGHVMLDGRPDVPPIVAYDWLVYAAIVGAIMGVIESAPRMSPWLIALLRLLAVAGLVDVMLSPFVPDTLSVFEAWAWGVSVTLFGVVIWSDVVLVYRYAGANAPLNRLFGGFTSVAIWFIVISGTSLALGLTGSAKLMQFGGALTAGLIPVMFFAAWKPDRVLARGICPVCVLILLGLLLNARFYIVGGMADWAILTLALAPLAIWFQLNIRGLLVAIVLVLIVLIPLIQRFNADMSEM